MTFPLSPASPFVSTITKVTASWLNGVRAALPAAVDGVGGGTYNLGIGNTLWFPSGGGNITIDAALGISAAFVPSGGNFTINGGGFLTVAPDATVSVSGTSGHFALVAVGAYGQIQFSSGGSLSVTSSGTVSLGGAMTVTSTGSITISPDGGIVWGGSSGHPGVALFQQYATATWQNGSFLTGNATATFAWSGPMTINGAMTVSSTGSIAISSGGALTTDLPASTVAVGANNIKSLGVAKSWGEVAVNASASPTVSDGFNVASVSASGTVVSVVFAQNMASTHYSVTFSTQSFTNGSGQQWPHPFVTTKAASGFSVEFRQSSQNSGGSPPWNAGDLIAPNAVSFPFSFDVHARQ